MSNFKKIPLMAAISTVVATLSHPVFAQSDASIELEEVVIIGSRSNKPRSASDSPVPVDVFSGKEFNSVGNSADITDNLKTLVPSYTATPATGDGSAFVRPTSLRGTAPDQTLVLVNGKRRHRSALVHIFAPAAGNGAHGPDVGMIPSIALKSVEVLRDGAAAQYGSDAIAGVINFQMKDASEGGDLQLQYGEFIEGEQSIKLAGNIGFELGENGFLNLSAEITDNDALSRGIQRPDAQALIDTGVSGVGADAPFGEAPLAQTWGRPETSGERFFINAGIDLSEHAQLYFQTNYATTEGRYRFFYRNPSHSTLTDLRALGFTGLEQGFTPFLDGDQTDYGSVLGVKGEFQNEMSYDISVGYGKNELDYFLNNTINQSLGLVNGEPAQMDFDVGGYEQEELNFNADFSKALTENLNFAFGAEWREETYIVNAGEFNSYQGAGSSGFKGIRPEDSGRFSRDNFALYTDVEQGLSEDFLLQYALRYEDFSDFGSTVNAKLAGRYKVTDTLTFRGAISTGFHAPTPGQANIQQTITTFDGSTGLQVEEGLVPATSELAQKAGGTALKEEESVNYSFGFTSDFGESTTLTLDFYKIEVDDRIYRTGDIAVPDTTNTISFYTNALDVEHQGMDIVLTSGIDWSDSISTDVTFAFSYNEIEVAGQTPVVTPTGESITPVSTSTIEDIENNFPNERFTLGTNTHFSGKWNFLLRANYYGSHYDERGTIGAAVDPSAEVDATIYVDMELGYDAGDNLRITLGGSNVFDTYVDKIGEGNANRLSVGLPYPRRSAANYEGASWYLRTDYSF